MQKLIHKQGYGLIKVIIGVIRCGKSFLLFTLFYNYLTSNGVGENHIIEIVLDDRSNIALRNPDNMLNYVKGKIIDKEKYLNWMYENLMAINFVVQGV